MNFPDTANSFF